MRLQWQSVMAEDFRSPGCDVTSEKCWKCAKVQVNGILFAPGPLPTPSVHFSEDQQMTLSGKLSTMLPRRAHDFSMQGL